MKRVLLYGLIVIAGLLMTPATIYSDPSNIIAISLQPDVRVVRLRAFFLENKYPIEDLADDFIAAADMHSLDWRLLPSISIVESSGGKRYLNNNIFGWDSCRVGFPSIRIGIYHVANRLSNSKLYKNKDLNGILRTYNPYETYPGRVVRIMTMLGASDLEPDTSRY